MPRAAVSWELLRRYARRYLAGQLLWLVIGLAGPLVLCLWTILRPFVLQNGYHYLQQCAIWLSAWYIVFGLLYTLNVWLRPHRKDEDSDLKHLPLSTTHFFLKRTIELCLIPALSFVMTLPLWFAVLVYIGVPYGQQWIFEEYNYISSGSLINPWAMRILWVTLAMLGGQLLVLAAALWLDEATPYAALRIPLLIGGLAAAYFGVKVMTRGYMDWSYDYGALIMCYRQTRGYEPLSFMLPTLLLILIALSTGLLSRRLRFLICGIAALAAIFIMLLPHLPAEDLAPVQPVLDAISLGDARQGLAYALGHLSAPKNTRMIFNSYTSNVLLAPEASLYEPAWPDLQPDPKLTDEQNSANYERAMDKYYKDYDKYNAALSKLPRLTMAVGAGLYPLLLALAALAGLLLGYTLRPRPAREE